MRRTISGLAAPLTALLLLAGCDGTAGVAEQVDDDAFATCVEDAGLSLEGVEDWSEAEERAFLSRPEALECVLSDVPEEEQARALERAFPDDEGDDEAADEARVAKTDALVGLVDARGSGERDRTVADVATLMNAFGWDGTDPWVGPRKQVALAMVRAESGAESYDAWLEDTGREDDYDGRIDFVQEQETEGTPLADEVRALADELESAQA